MSRTTSRIAPLVIVLLSSLLVAAPARANVRLTFFAIEQGPSSSQLVVKWTTETETNTAGFRIRRGANANPAQAADIHTEPARGTATTGYEYEHTDDGLTPGQVYYYWLVELEASGGVRDLDNGQATAGGGTVTPTATSQPATATPVPATATPVPATPVPPTATPQQPASQAPAATATPRQIQEVATATSQPAVVPTSAPPNNPAAGITPASPQATTTAPLAAPVVTAEAQKEATATVVAERSEIQQTLPQDPALAAPPVEGESTPAAEPRSASQAAAATATPQMLAEAPDAPLDAPQAQLVRPTATPRPTGSSDGSESTSSLLMVIGGGSLCGAALLVLVVIFVWRRR